MEVLAQFKIPIKKDYIDNNRSILDPKNNNFVDIVKGLNEKENLYFRNIDYFKLVINYSKFSFSIIGEEGYNLYKTILERPIKAELIVIDYIFHEDNFVVESWRELD